MIRSGFEPTKSSGSGTSDFAVGDDDEASNDDGDAMESDDSRGWKERSKQENPKSDYGTLDEGHVWKADSLDDV